jgi:hypothetical protein
MARLINTSLYSDANLQEYYQLENINGKNGNTLTNNGSVAFNAARYGNGADGGSSNTTKYLRLTNKLGFGSGDYSISFWVKINTDPSNSTCDLIEIVDGTNGVSMEAGYQDSGGVKNVIAYWLRAGVASNDIVVNTALGTSNFHHIVVVRDSGVLKLYLDGSLIGSIAITAGTGSGVTDSFTILAGRNNTNNISGIIDDVALFNRALSSGEVTTIFNDASSPSASASPSVSPSASSSSSISPSASRSPSSSNSPSISPSASLSPSASRSPSSSISASLSPSGSISPSASMSASLSPSPSPGYVDYTRGEYANLPPDTSDLAIAYSDAEKIHVEETDGIAVGQVGTLTYMLHQFKRFVGNQALFEIEWSGSTTLDPGLSPVYLQVFNQHTQQWETIDSNRSAEEGITFELEGKVSNVPVYLDADGVLAYRVYQLAI